MRRWLGYQAKHDKIVRRYRYWLTGLTERNLLMGVEQSFASFQRLWFPRITTKIVTIYGNERAGNNSRVRLGPVGHDGA